MPFPVTSAAGVDGDGYGMLLAFDRTGRSLGAFSSDPRISDPRGLAVAEQNELLYPRGLKPQAADETVSPFPARHPEPVQAPPVGEDSAVLAIGPRRNGRPRMQGTSSQSLLGVSIGALHSWRSTHALDDFVESVFKVRR